MTDTPFNTGLPPRPRLELQCCGDCGQVNYPPRELCGHCLADALSWQPVTDSGTVQSLTELHYSLEPLYAGKLPWQIASVRLDCGPIVIAHLLPGTGMGASVRLQPVADAAGTVMLLARESGDEADTAVAQWLTQVDFREIKE